MTDAHEQWRVIPAFPRYEVSDYGRARRIGSARTMRGHIDSRGYIQIWVGSRRPILLHRAILTAFGYDLTALEVNHKNGMKTDNRLINLESVTRSQNMRHAFDVLHRRASKSRARLTATDVVAIRALLLSTGLRKSEIAAQFGVSRTAVSDLAHGRSWTDVQ